jgi:hypothetical protein
MINTVCDFNLYDQIEQYDIRSASEDFISWLGSRGWNNVCFISTNIHPRDPSLVDMEIDRRTGLPKFRNNRQFDLFRRPFLAWRLSKETSIRANTYLADVLTHLEHESRLETEHIKQLLITLDIIKQNGFQLQFLLDDDDSDVSNIVSNIYIQCTDPATTDVQRQELVKLLDTVSPSLHYMLWKKYEDNGLRRKFIDIISWS